MNSKTLSGPWAFVSCDRGTKISKCEKHAGQASLTGLVECGIGGGRFDNEEVIKNVTDKGNTLLIQKDPVDSIRQHI